MERHPTECVSDIHNQTNRRISDRNIPSHQLQPYLTLRPVMTKYSYLPIVDPRARATTSFIQQPTYNVHQVFNPGNAMAPWSGFAANINTESVLRNQVYALQKCSQAVYVPSTQSDLYTYQFQTQAQPNPHELLFKEEVFDTFDPNPAPGICGGAIFNNSTRCQVKDITR